MGINSLCYCSCAKSLLTGLATILRSLVTLKGGGLHQQRSLPTGLTILGPLVTLERGNFTTTIHHPADIRIAMHRGEPALVRQEMMSSLSPYCWVL